MRFALCNKWKLVLLLFLMHPALTVTAQSEGEALNITPFGAIHSWNDVSDPIGQPVSYSEYNEQAAKGPSNIGVSWWNARDIAGVEVLYKGNAGKEAAGNGVVQYWQYGWPEHPPHMPSMDDQEDDPWRGKWVTAQTNVEIRGNRAIYTFQPLTAQEIAEAANLPEAVTYRRTLKIRLFYEEASPGVAAINVQSTARVKKRAIRIQLGCGTTNQEPLEAKLEIANGYLQKISPWNWDRKDQKTGDGSWKMALNGEEKGIIAVINTAEETLPGSNTETIVTVRSNHGTFSFSTDDLENGPIYIPHYNAYISRSSDPVSYSKADLVQGKTIREMIAEQPEQSYQRARKEIPHLDPFETQHGERIYIPIATDANWQKFAIIWGGNIMMDKKEVRAQGKELLRCNWTGNDLRWSIGTGIKPEYEREKGNCQMSVLEGYLPVVTSRWRQDGLLFEEEAFTTLLEGPLDPEDPARDEQTPAILMLKVVISNPSLDPKETAVWLSGNEALNGLVAEDRLIMDQVAGEQYIRCYISGRENGSGSDLRKDTAGIERIVHQKIKLEPNSSRVVYFYFPFVGDLPATESSKLAALDYESEKNRVVAYWRDVVAGNVVYNVPEQKFNAMARAVIPHIRMGTTKDPKSGLYMVPAAALRYMVFPNEAVFQTNLLDRAGDLTTAGDYLNTFLELQGSRKLPGNFSGEQEDVFYGVKVTEDYDLTSLGYNMHHGTVLWGLSHHYLLSGDKEWFKNAVPHMIRAADWIIEQRKNTMKKDGKGNKVLHYGLLPAGSLEDVSDWRFWYATNAYSYLGLVTMARAFERAGMDEAAHYRREAAAYLEDIRNSIKKASELSPVVRLRNGTYVPYIPTRAYQRFRYFGSKKREYYDRYGKGIYPTMRLSATREVLYGPVVFLKTGLVGPHEPMADWILDDWEDNLTLSTSLNLNTHGWVDDEYWFSRGGMVFQANLQNPVGAYLLRREIPAAIRNLYNDFVSCLYPEVNMLSEEYRLWKHGSGPFYKSPDEARFVTQICDILAMQSGDELWLASGTPQRWLEPGQKIEVTNMHTEFGKLSYTLKHGTRPGTITADITLPESKASVVRLFLRTSFEKPIRSVTVNGSQWDEWNAEEASIVIPQTEKEVHVVIIY